MRIYQKISESDDKVVYEYLWGTSEKPFTGLVEINKKQKSASALNPATDEWDSKKAGAYALYYLPKKNYPKRFTHTAV